ncbi:MAG: hypothetical protein J6Q59_08465, partial [Paludibacteraceae bacterium]|nr:hypothetical protein [Paludibacteraceae bacterium]
PTAIKLVDADKIELFEIYDSSGKKAGEIVTDKTDIAKKLKEMGVKKGIYILTSPKEVLKIIVD